MVEYDPRVTRKANDIVESIDDKIKECWAVVQTSRVGDGREVETLSRAVMEIPSLMGGLGYWLAEAESEMDRAKDMVDFMKEDLPLKAFNQQTGKVSMTQAEKIARTSKEYRTASENYLVAKRTYRLLKVKYDSTAKTFEGIRSRLSVIKQDIRGAE